MLAPDKWRKFTLPSEERGIVELGQNLGVTDAQKLEREWPIFKSNAMKHELYCGSNAELKSKPEVFYAG